MKTTLLLVAACLDLAMGVRASGPNIVMQPANQRTCSGGNVMFSVYSDDTNALSYQWFKGENRIAGATDARLVLRNVTDADVDSYSVMVRVGADSTVSSNATLILYADGNVMGNSVLLSPQLESLSRIKAVACGYNHGLALRYDGTLLTFGRPVSGQYQGPYNIFSYLPPGLTNATAIAVDDTSVGMALQANGIPRVWAFEASRELPVPAEAHDVVDIAATTAVAVALRADGTVVCWQFNTNSGAFGATNSGAFVPDPITDAVAISAQSQVASVLRRNGTVLQWNQSGMVQFTPDVTNVCKLVTGNFSVVMLQDGEVITWFQGGGYNGASQTVVPTLILDPPTNIVELALNNEVLTSDGSLVPLQSSPFGVNTRVGLGLVEHVAGSVMIRQADTPVIFYLYIAPQLTGQLPVVLGQSAKLLAGEARKILVSAAGRARLSYQWFKDGKIVAGATSSALYLRGLTTDSGSYTVLVRNRAGATTSHAVDVSVAQPALTVSGLPSIRTTNDTVHYEGTYPIGNTLMIGVYPTVRIPPPPPPPPIAPSVFQYVPTGPTYGPTPTLETNGSIVSWSVDFPLPAGTNAFSFWNVGPDQGATITRQVYRVATSRLTMNIFGGYVQPNLNGRELEVGKTYTLRASPAIGFYFAGWYEASSNSPVVISGNLNSPTFTFTMVSNLVVNPLFHPNPSQAFNGLYRGLVYPDEGIDHETSGYIEVLLERWGTYTARLLLGGTTYRFSGSFSNPATNSLIEYPGLQTVVYLPRPGKVPLTVLLSRGYGIEGYVTDNYTYSFIAADLPAYNPDQAGRYTVVFAGATNNVGPFGNGYATVMVSAAGALTMVGSLADGTPISQSTAALQNGMFPLYVPLYKGNGSIISWVPVQSIALNFPFSWTRPSDSTGGLFAQGFTNEFLLTASRYSPTGNVFGTNQASIFVQSEDGNVNLVDPCAISSSGALSIDPSSGDDLHIYVNRATGSFSGSFVAPDTKQVVPVRGAILQNLHQAWGYFLRTNQSGAFGMQ